MSIFGDINEVELLGNLTADPEIKYTTGGTAIATVNLATNRDFKQGEEWKKETTFTKVVFWAKLAEQVKERLVKGTRVLIKGRLQVKSWDDKETGKKQYRTEVVANEMILIDRFKKTNSNGTYEENLNTNIEDSINPEDLPF